MGGIRNVRYDMTGFSQIFWDKQRIRFLSTPGHGLTALSIIIDLHGQQIVFCGDAFYSGAKIWQPYNLEWDHWTGTGALAAYEGIMRLQAIAVDILCPSHGQVVTDKPRIQLKALAGKLLKLYKIKGNISPGEKDNYIEPLAFIAGSRKILDNLFQFGTNGYLLRSLSNQALIVDPFIADMPVLEELLKKIKNIIPTAAVVTHYHMDHCDGIEYLRKKYKTKLYLHPLIAEPLYNIKQKIPWLPSKSIKADYHWPKKGTWLWNEYCFQVSPWPGQTWWHCIFMASINGNCVAFGGDSFLPTSRWNGTGGFCAYNRSVFNKGFLFSARLILDWKPDIVACGHNVYYKFKPAKFKKIIQWAGVAHKTVKDLCPTGNLEKEYYNIDPGSGQLYWL